MNTISNIKNNFEIESLLEKSVTIDKNSDLEKAAEEFESLFINEMLKRANKAKLANSLLSSDEQDTYMSMLNQERSKQFAQSHNFGIAEALVKQFSPITKNSISPNNDIVQNALLEKSIVLPFPSIVKSSFNIIFSQASLLPELS